MVFSATCTCSLGPQLRLRIPGLLMTHVLSQTILAVVGVMVDVCYLPEVACKSALAFLPVPEQLAGLLLLS